MRSTRLIESGETGTGYHALVACMVNEIDKGNKTHKSLRNNEAEALSVTLVDRVIGIEDNVPDLDDCVITRDSPCLQSACGIQCKGKHVLLETILGTLGEVFE